VLPPLVPLISLESLLGGCKHSVSVPSVGIFESNHRHRFFNNLAIAASKWEFSYPGCGLSEAPSSPSGPSCQPPSSIAAAAGCEHIESRAARHRWCRRVLLSPPMLPGPLPSYTPPDQPAPVLPSPPLPLSLCLCAALATRSFQSLYSMWKQEDPRKSGIIL
jgi:hypothetical protein